MRFLLLSVISLASLCLLHAQNNQKKAAALPFIAYWAEGDVFEFEVTKIKLDYAQGQLTRADTSSYQARMEILKETETSYDIQWEHQMQAYSENDIPLVLRSMLADYEYTPVIYQTDELGSYMGIVNWEEQASAFESLVQELLGYAAASDGLSKKEREMMRHKMTPILAAYSSKEGVEQLIFKELPIIHLPFGAEFDLTDTLEYLEMLPNLLGGNPLRGETSIYFSEFDREHQYCEIKHEMHLNEEDAKDLLRSVFQQISPDDDEMEAFIESSTYDIKDHNTYEYIYNPGIPLRLVTERTILMDFGEEKAERIELMIIELID